MICSDAYTQSIPKMQNMQRKLQKCTQPYDTAYSPMTSGTLLSPGRACRSFSRIYSIRRLVPAHQHLRWPALHLFGKYCNSVQVYNCIVEIMCKSTCSSDKNLESDCGTVVHRFYMYMYIIYQHFYLTRFTTKCQ